MKSICLRLSLLLTCGLAFAHDAVAEECEPELKAAEIQKLVDAGSANALASKLMDEANLSAAFKDQHGEDRLRSALGELADKLIRDVTNQKADTEDGKTIDPQTPAAVTERLAGLENGVKAACEAVADGASEQEAGKAAVKAAKLSGGDSSYAFLLGSANSLEGDGRFSTGLEASFLSTTQFDAKVIGLHRVPGVNLLYKSNSPLVGNFELTFSEIGSIDDEVPEPADPNTPPPAMPDERNPFAVGGGFLRLNTSLDRYFSRGGVYSGIGFRLGGGFSTLPSEAATDDTRTRARGFAGLLFRANYGAATDGREGKGEVFLGYAKDKFWRYERNTGTEADPVFEQVDETERIVLDARMDVPGFFESDKVRLHGRLFADLPASGDGPSDIRISLLLTVDIGTLFPVN